MMMHKNAQQGIASIAIISVVLIVVVVLGGWYVWQRSDNATTQPNNKDTLQDIQEQLKEADDIKSEVQDSPAASTNELVLANDSVKFTLPESWTYTKGNDQCARNAISGIESKCLEGAIVAPGAMLPTKYGNGTEFFNIRFSVYEHSGDSDPKSWYQDDFYAGGTTDRDVEEFKSVNAQDTYFRKQINDVYHEVSYVFSGTGKMVLVAARTYEPAVLSNGQEVGDFRQYELPLETVMNTIVIDN